MTGDYGGFRRVLDEARQAEAADRARPLVDCPRCGTLLEVNSRGVKNCPLGHFRIDGLSGGV